MATVLYLYEKNDDSIFWMSSCTNLAAICARLAQAQDLKMQTSQPSIREALRTMSSNGYMLNGDHASSEALCTLIPAFDKNPLIKQIAMDPSINLAVAANYREDRLFVEFGQSSRSARAGTIDVPLNKTLDLVKQCLGHGFGTLDSAYENVNDRFERELYYRFPHVGTNWLKETNRPWTSSEFLTDPSSDGASRSSVPLSHSEVDLLQQIIRHVYDHSGPFSDLLRRDELSVLVNMVSLHDRLDQTRSGKAPGLPAESPGFSRTELTAASLRENIDAPNQTMVFNDKHEKRCLQPTGGAFLRQGNDWESDFER